MNLISGNIIYLILTLTSIYGFFNLSIETEIHKLSTKKSVSLYRKSLNFNKVPKDFTDETLKKQLLEAQDAGSTAHKSICGEDPKTFIPDIDDECKKHNVCRSVTNYPVKCADHLIQKMGISNLDDKTEGTSLEFELEPDRDDQFCEESIENIVPMAVRALASDYPAVEGEWYFVLNNVKKPVLEYQATLCKSKTSCNNTKKECGCSCRQGYYRGTLFAISRSGTSITIWADFIGCCECRCKLCT